MSLVTFQFGLGVLPSGKRLLNELGHHHVQWVAIPELSMAIFNVSNC